MFLRFHYVKSVQIWSYFWSVLLYIQYEYRKMRTRNNSAFGHLFMTWVGSQQEFLEFMSDLNKKQPSIKFEFKYSQTKIEFLDILVYKDQNNVLQTTIYRKQTDRQNYLDAQSEHPKLLKDNIPYSQVLQRENKF